MIFNGVVCIYRDICLFFVCVMEYFYKHIKSFMEENLLIFSCFYVLKKKTLTYKMLFYVLLVNILLEHVKVSSWCSVHISPSVFNCLLYSCPWSIPFHISIPSYMQIECMYVHLGKKIFWRIKITLSFFFCFFFSSHLFLLHLIFYLLTISSS